MCSHLASIHSTRLPVHYIEISGSTKKTARNRSLLALGIRALATIKIPGVGRAGGSKMEDFIMRRTTQEDMKESEMGAEGRLWEDKVTLVDSRDEEPTVIDLSKKCSIRRN